MTKYIIEPVVRTSLPVRGSEQRFPVRRVYCIGRNYAAHSIEMGGDPDRESPFFFQKNPDNLDDSGEFPYPVKSSDVHHEIELVVALKSGGVNISVDNALEHVYGCKHDAPGKSEKPSNALRRLARSYRLPRLVISIPVVFL